MVNFIESLSDEQRAQFQKVFKTIGNEMGVEVKEDDTPPKEERLKTPKKETSRRSNDFTTTKTKEAIENGRQAVRAKKNKWFDDGEFQIPNGEEEWSSSRKRATRSRGKTKKIQLECSVCGRSFMENPNLVYGEYHRCNRCGSK